MFFQQSDFRFNVSMQTILTVAKPVMLILILVLKGTLRNNLKSFAAKHDSIAVPVRRNLNITRPSTPMSIKFATFKWQLRTTLTMTYISFKINKTRIHSATNGVAKQLLIGAQISYTPQHQLAGVAISRRCRCVGHSGTRTFRIVLWRRILDELSNGTLTVAVRRHSIHRTMSIYSRRHVRSRRRHHRVSSPHFVTIHHRVRSPDRVTTTWRVQGGVSSREAMVGVASDTSRMVTLPLL